LWYALHVDLPGLHKLQSLLIGGLFLQAEGPEQMKIAVLSHSDVAGYYAATLMERGHKVTISGGGALNPNALKPYLECDACLLLGEELDLLHIADAMEAAGKKVWRDLAKIP